MKTIILGGGFYNKGAEAMSLTIINELINRKLCSEALFICSYGQYENAIKSIINEKLDHVVNVQMLPDPINYMENFSLINMFSGYDYAVDISGLQLSDKFGEVASINYWIKTSICKILNIPYFILPQALGPFENKIVNIFARKSFSNVDLIFPRDKKSFDYIEQLDKNILSKVHLSPDIAFLFERNWKTESIDSRLRITIIPNVQAYNRINLVNGINYYKESIKVIIESCPPNSVVTLLPHQYNDSFDDLDLANSIVTQIDRNDIEINIIKEVRTARYLKNIIKNSDIVITSRYHAAIASLSCGIPTMTIGWAEKYLELLSLFSLDKYSVDIDNINLENIVDMFYELINNRNELSLKISSKLNYILDDLEKNFTVLENKILEYTRME